MTLLNYQNVFKDVCTSWGIEDNPLLQLVVVRETSLDTYNWARYEGHLGHIQNKYVYIDINGGSEERRDCVKIK